MDYQIGDIVKTIDGRVKILALPSGFLSNGSYEVADPTLHTEDPNCKTSWVKPEDILYIINTEFEDDLDNYFEILYDEDGIHMIPKKVVEIFVDDEYEESKFIKFKLSGEEKHETIMFHVGDTTIYDSHNKKPKEEGEIEEKDTDKIRVI